MAVVRKSTLAALELLAADGHSGGRWTLTQLPECLTEQEREEVVQGCYEMLMVLAEAVAQPLGSEFATSQARRGASRSSIAPPSCSTSRLMPITSEGLPASRGPAMSRQRHGSDRWPTSSNQTGRSTTS